MALFCAWAICVLCTEGEGAHCCISASSPVNLADKSAGSRVSFPPEAPEAQAPSQAPSGLIRDWGESTYKIQERSVLRNASGNSLIRIFEYGLEE